MTDETPRCEPPPELRPETWLGEFAIAAHKAGWEVQVRLEAPDATLPAPHRTPPAVVAALVEALEGMMRWHPAKDTIARMGLKPEPAEAAYESAGSALAAYREAGR